MGEAEVINLKKKVLKEELARESPDKNKIERLKESIGRHKRIAKHVKYRRIKNRRRQRGESNPIKF